MYNDHGRLFEPGTGGSIEAGTGKWVADVDRVPVWTGQCDKQDAGEFRRRQRLGHDNDSHMCVVYFPDNDFPSSIKKDFVLVVDGEAWKVIDVYSMDSRVNVISA